MKRYHRRTSNKYQIVAEFLNRRAGTVLDVGARDRVLAGYLNTQRLTYLSADLDPGCDYQLDLENPLPLREAAFDHVVALDVLEHVERIHDAFGELARITRHTLTIALPNMAAWSKRLSFLLHGYLNGKYVLSVAPPEDRHRWLTTYAQINQFVEVSARKRGLQLVSVVEEIEGGRISGRLALVGARSGWFRGGLATARCIYILERISTVE